MPSIKGNIYLFQNYWQTIKFQKFTFSRSTYLAQHTLRLLPNYEPQLCRVDGFAAIHLPGSVYHFRQQSLSGVVAGQADSLQIFHAEYWASIARK